MMQKPTRGVKNPVSNKGSRLNCMSDERVVPEILLKIEEGKER